MAESSAKLLSGSSKSDKYSVNRSGSPRSLDDFSSEEEAASGKPENKNAKKHVSIPGAPIVKVISKGKKDTANSGFFTTGPDTTSGKGSGEKDGKPPLQSQLSATVIESSHESVHSPRSPGISGKKTPKNDNDNDNDNDVHAPLIRKGTSGSAKKRKASETATPLKRKGAAKASTTADIKTKGKPTASTTTTTTATTTTTTTTTTTATTATNVPKLEKSSSSSEIVEVTSSEDENSSISTGTEEKRKSYRGLSVQTEQQTITAVNSAESISSLTSDKQRETFKNTLGMIGQRNSQSRCAPLVKLASSLNLFNGKEQAAYLFQMRKLVSPSMFLPNRIKVINALVCAFAGCKVDNTASNRVNLDGEDSDREQAYPEDDARALKRFEQKIKAAKSRIDAVDAPAKQPSTDTIQQALQEIGASPDACLKLEVAIKVIDALDNHHDTGKKVIVNYLFDCLGDEIVATALLMGVLSKELEKCPEIKISPSAMLLGFIEGDKDAVKILDDFVTRTARTKPFLNVFHQRLMERSGKMSTPGENEPGIAAATAFLLMEMVTLSQLPEASRCRLIMYLYFMNQETLYKDLCGTRKQREEKEFDFAHRVIAGALDVASCSRLLSDAANDKPEQLSSYQDRIDAANGEEKQPRLSSHGKQLRDLLLHSRGDAAKVKEIVRKVLASSASIEDKLFQLQASEDAPVTDDLPTYVEQFYLSRANAYLKEGNPDKPLSLPSPSLLGKEKKSYYKTLSLIHKELPPDKLTELRKETKKAYDKALNSTLPAIHAAIMNDNVAMVGAYLDAVLERSSGLSSQQAMRLVEMPHKGKSAFYRALIRGTPEMIRTFIKAILASKLDETHKIDLLLARRESDNSGAFYIAMSSRDPERVEAFINAILASNLALKDKEKLLKCKKELGKGVVANRNKANGVWLQAKSTARSEAIRNEQIWASREQKITAFDKISYGARKIPSKVNPNIKRDPAGLHNREEKPSLVELFDRLIEQSSVTEAGKKVLKQ